MKRLLISICLLLLLNLVNLAPAQATGVSDLPPLEADTWVIDPAEAISRTNESQLITTLGNLAKNTGNEVRVVAIRRLDYGETIDSLSDQLFSRWFPTLEAQQNQTLLLIDTLTNRATIRTGETSHALLGEETINSILEETIAGQLKQGNKYNQALLDAGDRLVAVLSGEPDPGPPQIATELNVDGTFTKAEETDQDNATLWVIGLLLLATVIPMATYFFYVGFSN